MKSQIILLSLCLGIGLDDSSRAQMIGNPIDTRGSGEWTISGNGSYTAQQLGMDAVTKRLFIKSSWGITPWLDFYFLGGGVQLEMKSSLQNIEDYKDKIRLGYGAGLNAEFKPAFLPIISVCAGVQAIRFVSEGSFQEDFYFNNQVYQSIYQMQYDCREIKGYAGLVFPHRIFRFYAAGAVWYLQRMETKKEYWDTGDSSILLGQQDGEYGSGIWTGGIVGMDLLLPQNFAISIECLIFNMSNYQIMVGVCQTGGHTLVTQWSE